MQRKALVKMENRKTEKMRRKLWQAIKYDEEQLRCRGNEVGTVDGRYIRDSHGYKVGQIDGTYIRDSHGSNFAQFDGKVVRDSHGNRISTIEDIRKQIDGP